MNEQIPHETTNNIGEVSCNAYIHEQAQTGTLEASLPENASPSPSPIERLLATTHQTGDPFNLELLPSQNKIGLVKNGISKKQLEAIKSETDFDYSTLSNILSVSRTTLIKKKGDEKFDTSTSERIMHLAEILCYGRKVFECRDIFNVWVRIPSSGLGGISPLELLDTLYGIEEVKKELDRIEYGVF